LKQRSRYCFIFFAVQLSKQLLSLFIVVNIFLYKTVFGMEWGKNTDSRKPYFVLQTAGDRSFSLCFAWYKVHGKLRLNYCRGKYRIYIIMSESRILLGS